MFAKKYTANDLLRAAAANNIAEVIDILNSGVPVDSQYELSKGTALHLAAANGHNTMVQCLVAKGAKVDALDHFGDSPLIAAIYNGHEDIVAFLQAKGADVDVIAKAEAGDQSNALYRAALEGRTDKVVLLQRYGAKIDGSLYGPKSFTPLHEAAFHGNMIAIKTLLTSGASIDVSPEGHGSALHSAARNKQVKVIEYLIAAGADVNKASTSGTPLCIAIYNDHIKVAQFLLSKGALIPNNIIKHVILKSVKRNDVSILLMLLAAGLDANTPYFDDGKLIPLLLLAEREAQRYADSHPDEPTHDEAIKVLIAAGATDRKESTLLECAAARNTAAVIRVLDLGVQINSMIGPLGQTLLQVAAEHGHIQLVNALIARGAKVNETSLGHRRTALHYAAEQGSLAVVNALLDAGAIVDAKDSLGVTALGLALKAPANPDVIQRLVAAGAVIPESRDILGAEVLPMVKKELGTATLAIALGDAALHTKEPAVELGKAAHPR